MEFVKKGAINHLSQNISGNVLLLTQEGIYHLFEDVLKPQFAHVHVTFYTQISSNPKREEIQAECCLSLRIQQLLLINGTVLFKLIKN